MTAADPHLLRETFDASPELYDRVRLVPPQAVFDDLVVLARLDRGSRVVEIGCGTGQATLPLAERGLEILGVELGASLAVIARQKLAAFPRVQIVNSSFEDWDPAGELFDAVVAFNSFHWVDRDVRFAKSAHVLRDGGMLAVVGMRFVVHDDADPLWLELQDDYEAIAGVREPRVHVDEVRDRSGEFEASGWFRDVTLRRYTWRATFDAERYIAYLQTSSWHQTLAEDIRMKLFERIRARIGESNIAPTVGAVLYVAASGPRMTISAGSGR